MITKYYREYLFFCNFPEEIIHMGGFPLCSPGLIRGLAFLTKMKIVLTKARFDPE